MNFFTYLIAVDSLLKFSFSSISSQLAQWTISGSVQICVGNEKVFMHRNVLMPTVLAKCNYRNFSSCFDRPESGIIFIMQQVTRGWIV